MSDETKDLNVIQFPSEERRNAEPLNGPSCVEV
jgi:hypothetical protein